MAYPNSATSYTLPFGDKVRVDSSRRFILVRQHPEADAKPFIVRRSESRGRLENGSEFNRGTDYIIDQADLTITYYFNGHKETVKI
jgi:hypothetical protein